MNAELQNKAMRENFHTRGYTGKRCIVHLLDTGDKRADRGDKDDTNSHGTFVGNIIREGMPDVRVCSHKIVPGGISVMRNALGEVYKEAKADRDSFHIVNMSVSLETQYKTDGIKELEKTIDKLVEYGVPVICAAGNDDESPMFEYPACFHSPVCTTAIYPDGTRAKFSNFPNESDFTDHGVYVTVRGETRNGTSASSPQVCWKYIGMACEYEDEHGRWPTDAELYEIAKVRVGDLGDVGLDPYFGWGYIDITKAAKEETPVISNEFNFVVDAGLKWARQPDKLKKLDTIVAHHSSSDGSTIKSIHQQHLNDGHAGCDYNYVIEPDGVIYMGRGFLYEGGHVGNEKSNDLNEHSCGICITGAIHKHAPSAAQVASAKKLIRAILALNGKTVGGVPVNVATIYGHREVPYYVDGKLTGKPYPTVCPGEYMPMDEFKALLTGDVIEPAPEPEPEPTPVLTLPALYTYSGSSNVNVRSGPGTNHGKVGRYPAKDGDEEEACIVLTVADGWAEIVLHEQSPMVRGWCIDTYLLRA